MDEKVSIIIPVYNAEKYVEESIQSALNQTYSNIEIIAVDDGSTDDSLEILKNYSDKITVSTISHSGQPAALNGGIKKMTGSWFKLLAADDLLYPNAVEELILASKNFKDKKHYVYVSNFYIINSNGEILYEIREPDYNKMNQFDFNVLLLDRFMGNIITSLIHKSTIDDYGLFNEGFTRVQDYELWLRYCLVHNVHMYFVPKILAKNRWHDETLTNTLPEKEIRKEEQEVREHILKKLEPTLRQKYELSLKQYRKRSITARIYRPANNLIKTIFPKHISDKIARQFGSYVNYSEIKSKKIYN